MSDLHLPYPPTDDQVYEFFDNKFWPFVWLFVTELALLFGFFMVMRHDLYTLILGALCLAFMLPPVCVGAFLRFRNFGQIVDLDSHLEIKSAFAGTGDHDSSVDVFLPVCGEDIAVLQNTFYYVSRLQWDGPKSIHVLDDGDSVDVERLAAHYGFNYVVRENRGWMKKAGNLINAFNCTSHDFILVLDADFVPRRDFLWETLPYMEDRSVGVVQTSQFFNVDKRYNFISRSAGALQEFFFRWIQCQRDLHNAAICAGTNVIYRRSAVEHAGGFAQTPIGEDVHSGVKLWASGYRTKYVPLAVATGLSPDTFNTLVNQQYRWCRSSMCLMVDKFFRAAPFNKKQRICFWAGFMFYMASALIPMTAALPGLLMVWLYPRHVHAINYLPLIPAFLSSVFFFRTLSKGWRIGIYRICTINSFCHLLACIDAIRGRVEPWVPTGDKNTKATTPSTVALMFRVWFVLVQALLWTGIARDIHTYSPWNFVPIILLTVFQFYMLCPIALKLPYNDSSQEHHFVWPHIPNFDLFARFTDTVIVQEE